MRNVILFSLFGFFSQNNLAIDFTQMDRFQTNANPFVRIHSLPGYSGTKAISEGRVVSQIDLDITNEFHLATEVSEQVFLDYERTQLNLSFQYGVADDLSVGLVLPYISNSGGFMDGLIENWHDLFGLPQGGRDNAARDEFRISYQNAQQSLLIDETDQGIGDVSLFLDKKLTGSDQHKLKIRTILKLPTGDEDQLFGSGGYAFSMSLNGSRQFTDKWQAYGMVGLSYLEDSDVLSELQTNIVGTAAIGVAWRIKPNFSLAAQLDFNSEVYDEAQADAINGQAGVLNISAGYQFSEKTSLLFGFNEDVINKDGAPDFGINLALRYEH